MAVNASRRMNRDLVIGLTEGVYKSRTPDRGGEVEPSSEVAKRDLDSGWYGRTELAPVLRDHVPGRAAGL